MIQYALILANIIVVALGGLALSASFKVYKRNSNFSMLCLTIGFSLLVAAPLTGMILPGLRGLGFWETQVVESGLIAVGFAFIVHSIYAKRLWPEKRSVPVRG